MDKMLQEVKRDEKWRNAIVEELNCTKKKAKYKIIEKFQKILTSSISNSLAEIDKVKEFITFHSTANTFMFFEKISTVFQFNLIVNELCFLRHKLLEKLQNPSHRRQYPLRNKGHKS